jgi:sec-independent protein translocase protein TatC
MTETEKSMSPWDHISEMRKRLFVALMALAATTLLSFFIFSEYLANILAKPIGGLNVLVSIEVTENVSVFMEISLLCGFILAMPIILYEILGFVMPGLHPNERRYVWVSIPLATIFFLSGVLFAYYVMLPTALPFLMSFMGIKTLPRANHYFGFVTNLLFWIGLSFETPLIIYVLAKLHLVTARMLAKQWRIAIVVIAVLAAIITPTPDPINMGLLMIPLAALYVLSILFAYAAQSKEKPEKPVKQPRRRGLFRRKKETDVDAG